MMDLPRPIAAAKKLHGDGFAFAPVRLGSWRLLLAFVVAGDMVACNDVGDFPTITTTRSSQRRASGDAGLDGGRADDGGRAQAADASARDAAFGKQDAATSVSVVYVPLPDGEALDAGSSGVDALYALLAGRSSACLQCALVNCPSSLEACGRFPGRADAGASAGARKASLCIDAFRCVFESQCSLESSLDCYCGDAITEQCLSTHSGGDGPCKDVLESAFETTDQRLILSRLDDHSYEGGWAISTAKCLFDNDCASCFPEPSRDQ